MAPEADDMWMALIGGFLMLIGLGLLALNLIGMARGLALYPVAREFDADERRRARTRPIQGWAELRRWADEDAERYAGRMARAINGHLIHSMGSQFPRVSAFHNWILWLLGVFVPSRFQYLEFRNARYALQRGFGLCSQAAMALADLLSRAGIPAAIGVLEGHTVVTAETAPGRWIVLDPDYGVAIPNALEQVHAQATTAVPRAYGDLHGPAAVEQLTAIYAKSYRVIPGPSHGEKARGAFERLVFFLKWAIPLLLVGVGIHLWRRGP